MYTENSFEHEFIYSIKHGSGSLWSKEIMIENDYTKPTQDMYFVFQLEEKIELGTHIFDLKNEDFKKRLDEAKQNHKPFTLNLLDLVKIRKIK